MEDALRLHNPIKKNQQGETLQETWTNQRLLYILPCEEELRLYTNTIVTTS